MGTGSTGLGFGIVAWLLYGAYFAYFLDLAEEWTILGTFLTRFCVIIIERCLNGTNIRSQFRRVNETISTLTLERFLIEDCVIGTFSALVNGCIVIRLIRRTESYVIGGNTDSRVSGVDGLVLWTCLACFVDCYSGFICRALYFHASVLCIIEFFHSLALYTFLSLWIEVCIALKLANPAHADPMFISKFPLALLTLTCGKVDELTLLTEDTLLLSHVKHTLGTVKTGL